MSILPQQTSQKILASRCVCVFCSCIRDFCCSGAFSAAREIPGTNAGPGDLESRAPGGACEQGGPTQVSRAPTPMQTRKQTEKAHSPGRLLHPSATFTGELMSIHVVPGNHVNHYQTPPLFRRILSREAGPASCRPQPRPREPSANPPPPPPLSVCLSGRSVVVALHSLSSKYESCQRQKTC